MQALRSHPNVWPHQRAAVGTILRYLRAYRSKETRRSAMVQMPTGTGKTGVIALAANDLSRREPVLVLSPRIALCEQLAREIDQRFFARVLPDYAGPRKRVVLWEAGQKLPTESLDETVLVCTIQKLQRTFKLDPATHEWLCREISLVLVDEGHYEPALEWRDAIRRLHGAKVIFTATPFRNDFKLFDIDFAHVFRLSLAHALRDRFIRDVRFVKRTATTRREFVRDVVAYYDRTFGVPRPDDKQAPRVIIRCDSHPTILAIAGELASLGRTYVAIHEQFSLDEAKHEYRRVPDPRETDATFWIHQYKLLEGIDDPRFRLLAMPPEEELGSVRTVVQQIGRVLRNPDCQMSAPAYVLDYSGGELRAMWENFLDYEALVDREGVESLDLGRRLIESLRKSLPDLIYVDGRFRAPASLEGIAPYDELVVPLTANLHQTEPGFDMAEVAASLEQDYLDRDQIVQPLLCEPNLYVALHVVCDNSPLLASRYFMEVRLCATVVVRRGGVLFFLDTGGGVAADLPGVGLPLPSRQLKRLFRRSEMNRLTGISLRGSNVSSNAIRTRSFTAASIRNTMPSFDDKANICTTAKGSVADGDQQVISRYLGFTNAKLTDSAGERATLREYLTWTDKVIEQLRSSGGALAEFSRYALESEVPQNPAPRHILIDLDEEIASEFFTHAGARRRGGRRLAIEDAAAGIQEIDGAHSFRLRVNGQACRVRIEFDAERERYHLTSPDLDRLIGPRRGPISESLLHYLNREQSFRVIPESIGYFYTAGQFFKPEAKFGPSYDDDELGIFKLLEPASVFSQMKSEKGGNGDRGSKWPTRTVFRCLDDLGLGTPMASLLAETTVAVCDDLGTEAADFIFASAEADPPRVVFAHAKASPQRKPCSASALQEVCAQAAKNSRYLARFNDEAPPKMPRWHTDDWQVKRLGPMRRIRVAAAGDDGPAVWRKLRVALRDWRTHKEIWLVLGHILSRKEFERQIRTNPPGQEAVQIAMLLFTTAQAANAAGARLRVFCMP